MSIASSGVRIAAHMLMIIVWLGISVYLNQLTMKREELSLSKFGQLFKVTCFHWLFLLKNQGFSMVWNKLQINSLHLCRCLSCDVYQREANRLRYWLNYKERNYWNCLDEFRYFEDMKQQYRDRLYSCNLRYATNIENVNILLQNVNKHVCTLYVIRINC